MVTNDQPNCRSGAHLCIGAIILLVCSAVFVTIGPASVDDAIAQTPDCGGVPIRAIASYFPTKLRRIRSSTSVERQAR